MTSYRKSVCFVAVFTGCASIAGCGSSDVVPVSGVLTYKGKAVTNAYVHFVPEKGRPSLGTTDSQGQFTLTYDPENKGAQKGKHRVFVEHNVSADQFGPGAIPGMPVTIPADLKTFFEKYNGTNSKIEITIDKAVKDLKLAWD